MAYFTTKHVTRAIASIAASGTTAAIYVGDLDSCAVGVFGTWAGSVTIEESPDGTEWFANGANLNAGGYHAITAEAQYVRINWVAKTSGTVEAAVGGQQRDPMKNRFQVASLSTDAATSSTLVFNVADIEDARLWTAFSTTTAGSNVVTPQYSPDGTYWANIAAAASAEASYAVPDNALQVRLLVSVVPSVTPTTTAILSGKKLRKGPYLSESLGRVSAATSGSAIDCTAFRGGTAFFMAESALTASVALYATMDGTNFFNVGAVSDASGTVTLPEWAVQCKMVATAWTSGAILGYICENTGLRTD